MSRKIAWEKWCNEEPEDQVPMNDDFMEDITEDFAADFNLNFTDAFLFQKINTPFGEFLPDDPMCPNNMFDCWVAHTNFPITQEISDIIDNQIEGIGAFKVMSKYRFFIGVERLFSFSDVRQQIQRVLCDEYDFVKLSVDNHSQMQELKETFGSIGENEKWAVFLGHDKKVRVLRMSECVSEEDYQEKLEELKSLKNGNIITCE